MNALAVYLQSLFYESIYSWHWVQSCVFSINNKTTDKVNSVAMECSKIIDLKVYSNMCLSQDMYVEKNAVWSCIWKAVMITRQQWRLMYLLHTTPGFSTSQLINFTFKCWQSQQRFYPSHSENHSSTSIISSSVRWIYSFDAHFCEHGMQTC